MDGKSRAGDVQQLLAVCKQLLHDLDETDHEDVYLAMDVKSKTEWLQRVLQIAEEQEE